MIAMKFKKQELIKLPLNINYLKIRMLCQLKIIWNWSVMKQKETQIDSQTYADTNHDK